jgi:uncharacterized membrane protein YphA (DoxX/SURF4 family)
VVLFGRITLGLVFGLSGVMKAGNMPGFTAAVRGFHLLPPRLVAPFAMTVVLLELGAAAALLVGVAVEVALVLSLVLLALFTIALALSLREGQSIACQCFGQLSSHPVSWGSVLRNALLAGLAGVTLVSSPSGSREPLSGLDAVNISLLSLGTLAFISVFVEASELVRGQRWTAQ